MDILVSVILPLALAFIMFSLGVGLTAADFLRVGQRPVAFMIGAVHQIVLLPLVAYAIILIFGIAGEFAVGMMILAACPGGVTSNIISRLARGDVALSVSLTAIISLTSMFTAPIILSFALNAFMGADAPDISIASTAFTMFLLTVVPIMLALGARRIAPGAMTRVEPLLTKIATVLFVVIITAALASNWDAFVANLPSLGPALLTLLAVLTALGFFIPRMFGRSLKECKTVSIETGIQNGSLGITIAAVVFGASQGFGPYSLPSAVYGIVMYAILLPVLLVYRRMD